MALHRVPEIETPSQPKSAIAVEIRRLRDEMGMTLQDFGRHCGIPWQTIQAYETSRTEPPSTRLLQIVHATRRAPQPFRIDHVARAVALAA